MTSKVAIVSFGAWTDSFEERIESIADNVNQLTIYKPPQNGRGKFDSPCNVTVEEIGPKRRAYFFPLYPIIFILTFIQKGERYDAIHSLDFYIGPFCGLIASFYSSPKFIMSMRGLPRTITDEYVFADEGRTILRFAFQHLLILYYNILFYFADTIIVKAEGNLGYYEDISIFRIRDKTKVIPTGVDIERFAENVGDFPNPSRKIENAIEPNQSVVYLGRIVRGKGIRVLIDNHKNAETDYRLILIGEGDNGVMDMVESSVKNEDSIQYFNEWLPHKDIPKILSHADAVALLSELPYEGTPKIIQESLVTGTPVITSDITGISESFQDIDGCILINPTSPTEYANALRELQNVEVDVDRCQHKFDIKKTYAQVARCYDDRDG